MHVMMRSTTIVIDNMIITMITCCVAILEFKFGSPGEDILNQLLGIVYVIVNTPLLVLYGI